MPRPTDPARDPRVAALGPLERICRPGRGAYATTCATLLSAALLSGGLPFMVAYPLIRFPRGKPLISQGPDACLWTFLAVWLAFLLVLSLLAARRLAERLILGRDGIALWSPWRVVVVTWDRLRTDWRLLRPGGTDAEAALVLEHADGRRVAIAAFFVGYQHVVQRVLDKLAPPASELFEPRPSSAPAGSSGIKQVERGVIEPGQQ